MVERVEDYVRAFYTYLRIPWPPEPQHLDEAVRLFPDRLEVFPGPATCCFHDRKTDFATIYTEEGLDAWHYQAALGEEFAHALFTLGMGLRVGKQNPKDWKTRRLARLCEQKEEAVGRSFLYAWFLPKEIVLAHYYDERFLIRASGCPRGWVQERRGELWPYIAGLKEWRGGAGSGYVRG